MIKNSFQLPVVATATDAVPLRSAPPTQPEPPQLKKSPGRPPKSKSLGQTTPGSARPSNPIDSTPKKTPGRPPKAKTPGSVNGPLTGKRPRGRPPRQQQPAVAEVPFVQPVYDAPADPGTVDGQSVKKRRGGPFKNKAASLEWALVPVTLKGAVFGTPKKSPGRPPKAKGVATVGSGKPRGRPKRNVLAPVGKVVGKKPRGHFSKQAGLAPGVAGGKRRGRPPRGSVPNVAPWKLARKYVGKPRGRPRKIDASKQTSKQVAAYQELMKKVKNMQATVKDAVGVLRPFVPNEDRSDAMAALQQLEHLSTMSITASPLSPTPKEPSVTTTYEASTVEVQPNTSVPGTESITVSTMVPPVVPFSNAAPSVGEAAPLYAKQPIC